MKLDASKIFARRLYITVGYITHFSQPDSIIPDGVQGYDRYAYVANNPINRNDPTGHTPICIYNWDDQQQKMVKNCRGDGTGQPEGPIPNEKTIPKQLD